MVHLRAFHCWTIFSGIFVRFLPVVFILEKYLNCMKLSSFLSIVGGLPMGFLAFNFWLVLGSNSRFFGRKSTFFRIFGPRYDTEMVF